MALVHMDEILGGGVLNTLVVQLTIKDGFNGKSSGSTVLIATGAAINAKIPDAELQSIWADVV